MGNWMPTFVVVTRRANSGSNGRGPSPSGSRSEMMGAAAPASVGPWKLTSTCPFGPTATLATPLPVDSAARSLTLNVPTTPKPVTGAPAAETWLELSLQTTQTLPRAALPPGPAAIDG